MSYLEDVIVGAQQRLGTHIFDEAEMIAFARAYDPRDYYISAAAAQNGPFGALVASGWFVIAVWMQMMTQTRATDFWQAMSDPAAQQTGERPARMGPSPGFLDLAWPHPVCPGDEITYAAQVHKIIKLKSRPEWGIARNLNEGRNQDNKIVMRFFGQVLIERRHPEK